MTTMPNEQATPSLFVPMDNNDYDLNKYGLLDVESRTKLYMKKHRDCLLLHDTISYSRRESPPKPFHMFEVRQIDRTVHGYVDGSCTTLFVHADHSVRSKQIQRP